MSGKGRDVVYSSPTFPANHFINGRISTITEVSPRCKGSKHQMGLPRPGVLHLENDPLECLAFKLNGACVQEICRAVGNRENILNGMHKISYSETQCKGSNWKGAQVRYTCQSCCDSWIGRSNQDSPWGHKCWQHPFYFTMKTLVLASTTLESSFWSISPGALPTYQWLAQGWASPDTGLATIHPGIHDCHGTK